MLVGRNVVCLKFYGADKIWKPLRDAIYGMQWFCSCDSFELICSVSKDRKC